jgi:membrane protein
MILPGRDVPWKDFGRALWRDTLDDNLLDYAGSCAFSAILAVFPFLLFAVALAGLVIDPVTLATLIESIRRAVPEEAAGLLIDRVRALSEGSKPGLVTVGAVVAVWSASSAVAALATAFNIAYDVRETRPFWKTRGLALLLTLAGAVLFVTVAGLAIAARVVLHDLPGPLGAAVLWLRWPTTALLITLLLACLYYLLPNLEQEFRLFTPGSLVAAALWIFASAGFSFYAGRFGKYEVVYGALGGVIVLLLWLWISALAVLLGAEINAVLAKLGREQRQPDE